MIEIIENCSPYYIKFTFPKLEEIVSFAKSLEPDYSRSIKLPTFIHEYHSIENAKKIINMLPFAELFPWQYSRVSPIVTMPYGGSNIHKDGKTTKTSFNLPIEILDDKCVTYWYADEELADCLKIDTGATEARRADGWESKPRKPLKITVQRSNEMILFNTDIFHRWDNSKSNNFRTVLTFRTDPKFDDELTFEKVSSVLLAHS